MGGAGELVGTGIQDSVIILGKVTANIFITVSLNIKLIIIITLYIGPVYYSKAAAVILAVFW